jgi:hypothetical protein
VEGVKHRSNRRRVARGEGLTIQGRWRRFLRGFWRGEAAPDAGDTESGDGVLGDVTCCVGGAGGRVTCRRITEGEGVGGLCAEDEVGPAQARV